MTEPHDWYSNLNPFERATIRQHEKAADEKSALMKNYLKGSKARARLELEIAGHQFFRSQMVNRGVQRARLGIKTRAPKKSHVMTHLDKPDMTGTALNLACLHTEG